jgi:hypothetical protein
MIDLPSNALPALRFFKDGNFADALFDNTQAYQPSKLPSNPGQGPKFNPKVLGLGLGITALVGLAAWGYREYQLYQAKKNIADVVNRIMNPDDGSSTTILPLRVISSPKPDDGKKPETVPDDCEEKFMAWMVAKGVIKQGGMLDGADIGFFIRVFILGLHMSDTAVGEYMNDYEIIFCSLFKDSGLSEACIRHIISTYVEKAIGRTFDWKFFKECMGWDIAK